jgi:choline kinase
MHCAPQHRPRAAGSAAPGPGGYVPGEPVAGEVAVYFGDDPRYLYQLRQWLPVLARLHERHPTVLVTGHPDTYAALLRETTLPCVLAPTWPDLIGLYESSDLRVAVYVNNSDRNFLSLAAPRMLHVHVNHGESDKVCMVSNQVKAYDRVFVAGEAAVLRHRAALLEFDAAALVRVGRPQLDLRPEPVLPPSPRRTILYAPTWQGENESNNYTSLDVLGVEIAAAALAVPDVRVVYKPHPRVALGATPAVAAAHERVAELVAAAARRNPAAGHQVAGGDVLAVLPACDLMITDVSSVGLDFLYLHTGKPLVLADRYADPDRLRAAAPISRCADVVDVTSVGGLTALLGLRLVDDVHRAGRAGLRRHYFGDLAPGESTERFVAAIGEVVAARDAALARTLAGPAAPPAPPASEPHVAILAAGMGTRLGMPTPKPLTPLADGRSILQQQLDNLRGALGAHARITVVVGYQPELVMRACEGVLFAFNPRFAETNTSKSLLAALRASPPGGVLWLNGDVVFDPALLAEVRPLIDADRTFVCVDTARVGEEEVTYTLGADGYVAALAKGLACGLGEAIGINYVSAADKPLLVRHLERCGDQAYFERGLETAIAEDGLRVIAADISAYFAVEVDFAADLARANAALTDGSTSAA